MKILTSIVALLFTAGCSSGQIETYEQNTPTLSMEQYFLGKIAAYGILQDWRGKVTKRFHVAMEGTWQGDKGILKEHFYYDDGKEQTREWHWEKTDEHHFIGTADDVVGVAKGTQYGNAIYLRYTLKVPVDGKIIELNFDDRMYLVDGNVVLNKVKMKKFGFTVAELTISFVK
jgi:hypothetical protein